MAPRRTQVERTAATRAALVDAGRSLFGAEGWAAVGTGRIAMAAGMTRGALYHQFADKTDLFAAVLDAVEREIAERMLNAVAAIDPEDTHSLLLAGGEAFLDSCVEPDIRQIVLIDGPSVLGWTAWREICFRHSVGLIAALVADGVEKGRIGDHPVEPLTHVLIGGVNELALLIADSDEPRSARQQASTVLRFLADSLVRK